MAGGLRQRLGNRIALWRAGRVRAATGFTSQPEPRSIGTFARGRQLIAGNFLFAGHLVEAKAASIWALRAPDAGFAAEVQGFGWLDDLAAVGDGAARKRAQGWTFEWIAEQGRGQGAGWTPDLTGRRVIRWINHAVLLLQGQDKAAQAAYFKALTVQVAYLSQQWRQAAAGLARFEALTGLIVAGLALDGLQGQVAPAVTALARDCLREVDSEGGISTRNPEELLEVFTLLNWAEMALSEAGRAVPVELTGAIERIAPVLRALRHADGGLARFHGGGRGLEGRLDMALANAGVRRAVGRDPAMGFARLAAGRTTVIIDAAPPAPGGHASTLSFEMTSGRRPVVVNCGSGKPFGAEWELAGRATASHSVLALDGVSSSRMGRDGGALTERAGVPVCQMVGDGAGHHYSGEHTGWSVTHGLRHARVLSLDGAGRRLTGTDTLVAETPGEQKRFRQVMANRPEGVGFAVRFHLHPDVDATIDLGGTAVSLALKSGEIWVFRHDGRTKLTLEASVHLEKGRLQPRPARQIVLSGVTDQFEMRIGWTLAKAQDTPLAIRDLDREDLPVPV